MRKLSQYISLTAGLVLAANSGCSHLDVKEIPVTADPSQEIDKLAADQGAAYAAQVNVLSPKFYHEATTALRDAEKSRAKGEDSKVILKYVAEGKANLTRAREVAVISRSTMGSVVQAREEALTAGASDSMAKELSAIDKDLTDATAEIENERLTTAEKSRKKLTSDYQDLELKAIKKAKVGPALATIEQAIKEGAKENAPRTLTEALARQQQAEAAIAANRHDPVVIQSQTDAAKASADRLLKITRQAKVADKKDGEAVILEAETQEHKLNVATADQAQKASELTSAHAAVATLETEKSRLEADQGARQQLEAAKAQFTPSEADVYADGRRLVIRLKTLAFPSGKANLTPASFPLLGKVAKVSKDLGTGHITVEGHTDAKGSVAVNQKLSDERASAIRDYLIANGVADASRISAIGYGDRKPIASNKTSEGRAQNRRVDIIIEPTAVSH